MLSNPHFCIYMERFRGWEKKHTLLGVEQLITTAADTPSPVNNAGPPVGPSITTRIILSSAAHSRCYDLTRKVRFDHPLTHNTPLRWSFTRGFVKTRRVSGSWSVDPQPPRGRWPACCHSAMHGTTRSLRPQISAQLDTDKDEGEMDAPPQYETRRQRRDYRRTAGDIHTYIYGYRTSTQWYLTGEQLQQLMAVMRDEYIYEMITYFML